jgi:pyruvate carboxylase
VLRWLPTPAFYYGLSVGQTCLMRNVPAADAKRFLGVDSSSEAVDVRVTLKRVGPLKKERMRTVVFEVNGKTEEIEVKEPAGADEFDGPMADAANKAHVGAPMPGNVEKVFVKAGQVSSCLFPLSAANLSHGCPRKVASCALSGAPTSGSGGCQAVKVGETLALISAMKMEVQVKAQADGTVKSVVVSQGSKVIEGALLVVMGA